MMQSTLWTHTHIQVLGLTLLFTHSDLMLIAGLGTRWCGAVIAYGRITHTVKVWGGRKADAS